MKVPSSVPETAESLAAVGYRIHNAFAALGIDEWSPKFGNSFHASLLNESQRFGLWAKQLGLYENGHGSLDYRFRDAPSVYDYTHQLLDKLERSLLTIKDDLEFVKPPLGIIEAPQEDQTSDESSDEEESLLSYQTDSNCVIVLENAKLIIDTLYKLSFKIRNPATRLGFSKARAYRQVDEDTGVDLMDTFFLFDLRHVAETLGHYLQKSPKDCENHFLVQRLARANTHRRRQFAQWRHHVMKLDRSNHAPVHLSSARPDGQQQPVILKEKSILSLPSTATKFDESRINMDESFSVRSTSTTVVLSKEDEEQADIHIPPLPEKLRTKNDFECPYCHILCAKRTANQSAWERHVLRDLRPYVCTYEDCKEADQQYDSITDWVNHENNLHRQPECRMQKSTETSSNPHSPGQVPRQSLSDIFNSQSLTASDIWHEVCPFCSKIKPSFSHVALHLRKIASFALPSITGPDEEVVSGEQGSNIAIIDDQNSMSNNSTFETVDKDGMPENETNGHLREWAPRKSSNVATNEETDQEDFQHFKRGLQQVSGSTEKGIDIDAFITGLEPDTAQLYGEEDNNDSPASDIPLRSSHDNISLYARFDPLGPNYQIQLRRMGNTLSGPHPPS